jgi:hypothetical protein
MLPHGGSERYGKRSTCEHLQVTDGMDDTLAKLLPEAILS